MNGEVDMHFAINLRKAREAKGWTQEYLAEIAGLQPSWISHFEAARRHPSLMNFQAICCALRVPADSLLFGSNPPVSRPESKGLDLEALVRDFETAVGNLASHEAAFQANNYDRQEVADARKALLDGVRRLRAGAEGGDMGMGEP